MLSAAVCRTNQRQAAAKLADYSHFTGTRASLEVARRVADSKGGRLSRKESSSLRNAAVNAIWTKCRLGEAGYELETTLCDMCGQENDTLWHRILVTRRFRQKRHGKTWTCCGSREPSLMTRLPPNDKDLAVNVEILDAEAWNLGT